MNVINKINKTDYRVLVLLIIIFSAIIFIPFLGKVHLFDWDEINFAESAREMIISGDYSTVRINFKPFWEKPPLFIYFQVISMKIFGVSEFAARFPNAICGILTLTFLFIAGRKLKNNFFGILWVLSYAGATLPFIYFKSGIIDPFFNLFIFSGIVFLYLSIIPGERNKNYYLISSGILTGLAVLTKGPVGFLLFIFTISVFFVFLKFKFKKKIFYFSGRNSLREDINKSNGLISPASLFLFAVTFFAVGSSWFVIQIAAGNLHVIMEFIDYQIRLFGTEDAGHGGFFLYHFVVLMIGVFPSSVFAIYNFKLNKNEKLQNKYFHLLMIILLSVVLLVFSVVQTKIVHYSSLAYFSVTFLASHCIYSVFTEGRRISVLMKVIIIIIGFLYSLVFTLISLIDVFKKTLIESGVIRDEFVIANLQANGGWRGFEFIYAVLFFSGIIFSVILFSSRYKHSGLILLFIFNLLFSNLILFEYAEKIEKYTQNAAIEFYKSLSKENCYVETIGFKSYAHLFYTNKQPLNSIYSDNHEVLIYEEINKPAYFVAKKLKGEEILRTIKSLEKIYEKNGFFFMKRK